MPAVVGAAFTLRNIADGAYWDIDDQADTSNDQTTKAAMGTGATVLTQQLVPGTTQTPAAQTASFTTTGAGTWLCPPGVTSVQVECWAGGGGGGGGNGVGGGGGGGGGYARVNALAVGREHVQPECWRGARALRSGAVALAGTARSRSTGAARRAAVAGAPERAMARR